MCTTCAMLRAHSEPCPYDTASAAINAYDDSIGLTELADAAAGSQTAYSLAADQVFHGTLSDSADTDWVAVTLVAGESYVIDLYGEGSTGAVVDPLLKIHAGNGSLLLQNDDGGVSANSQLTFTPTSSGTYYLAAQSHYTGSTSISDTGGYALALRQVAATDTAEILSASDIAEYLTTGYWLDAGRIPHAFDPGPANVVSVNLTALSADGQQLARWALDAWADVTGLTFQETTAAADITYTESGVGGFASSTISGTEILSASVNIGTDMLQTHGTTIDSYSFQAYMHETGHALGLGHAGFYNTAADYGVDNDYANDSWQMSLMSYFSQSDNTDVDASKAFAVTPMMADIIAAQAIYGEGNAHAGNTRYGHNSNAGGYLETLFDVIVDGGSSRFVDGSTPVAVTLYDSGGIDKIDLRPDQFDQSVDLRGGGISDVMGLRGNLLIAEGTVIEKFIAGAGNDRVQGNGAANRLAGQEGRDKLLGAGGKDTLLGNAGRDKLLGGAGGDTLNGGSGNDRLNGQAGNDTLTGGKGRDVFIFNAGHDTITDFRSGRDSILLDDGFWTADLGARDVVDQFASIVAGDAVFAFDDGSTLTVQNIAALDQLYTDIAFA
jgi:serralysin